MNEFINEIDVSSFKSCPIAKFNADERLPNGENSSLGLIRVSKIIEETKDSYTYLLANYLKQESM
jgi:hypothetical protein